MSDDEAAREEKELDLTSPEVVTKYKSAAEILNSNICIYSCFLCSCFFGNHMKNPRTELRSLKGFFFFFALF